MLVLWLDCDREGEAIAFDVIDLCIAAARGWSFDIMRAHFSALTSEEISKAINNLKWPDKNMSDAV